MRQNLFCTVSTYLLYLMVGYGDGENELLTDVVKEPTDDPIQTIFQRRKSHV